MDLMWKICYLVCLLNLCVSGKNISTQTLHLLIETENVSLDCRPDDSRPISNYTLSWYFITEESETLISNNEVVANESRVIFELDVTKNNYQLVIKKVSGFIGGCCYTCQWKSTGTPGSELFHVVKQIDIEVYKLPDDPAISCDIENTDLAEGDTVKVTYNVSIGNVPANIAIWTTDQDEHMYHVMDVQIQEHNQFENRNLKINVTRKMKKINIGVSHNLLPRNLTCSTQPLDVKYRPRIQMPNTLTYKVGHSLGIPINLASNPTAYISWEFWKNNELTDSTACKEAQLNIVQDMLMTGELTQDDNGTILKIYAINSIGEHNHSVILYSQFYQEYPHKNPYVTVTLIVLALFFSALAMYYLLINRPIKKKAKRHTAVAGITSCSHSRLEQGSPY